MDTQLCTTPDRKTERIVVYVDPAKRLQLEQLSEQTLAPVSALARRALDEFIAKRQVERAS